MARRAIIKNVHVKGLNPHAAHRNVGADGMLRATAAVVEDLKSTNVIDDAPTHVHLEPTPVAEPAVEPKKVPSKKSSKSSTKKATVSVDETDKKEQVVEEEQKSETAN